MEQLDLTQPNGSQLPAPAGNSSRQGAPAFRHCQPGLHIDDQAQLVEAQVRACAAQDRHPLNGIQPVLGRKEREMPGNLALNAARPALHNSSSTAKKGLVSSRRPSQSRRGAAGASDCSSISAIRVLAIQVSKA